MDENKERTYLQCLHCGHIHTIERKIPMEKSVVRLYCPMCEYEKSLNCGYNEDDLAELRDPCLDSRYFF